MNHSPMSIQPPTKTQRNEPTIQALPAPRYGTTDSVATREAFGEALTHLGDVNPLVVALDADVKNSTFTEKIRNAVP